MQIMDVEEFKKSKDEYQTVTIEEIKNNLNNLNISNIQITDRGVYKFSDKIVNLLYNDYENPLVIKKDNFMFEPTKTLNVNPKWYEENKEICAELFKFICKNSPRKSLSIDSSEIINEELIDELCTNPNLEKVSLAEYDKNKFILSIKDYQKFKNSNIKTVNTSAVEDELKENFDPLIGYNSRNLISYYNYYDLQNRIEIDIYNKNLTKEELMNLKYIPDSLGICFNNDNYDHLKEIVFKLKELNKNNKIIISIQNKEKFNKYLLKNDFDYNNIHIKLGLHIYTLKEYLKFEKILYELASAPEELSPFEKYIYVYNITKKYKLYQENEEDLSSSRNLYDVLMNEYMVCVGFAHMLEDLLNKNSIENNHLSINVDTSYDKNKINQEIFTNPKTVTNDGHARSYIHIVDEKYGIDGFYIADPTWDNDLENDYYNHLVLTSEESALERRYLWNETYNSIELLNINSLDEYYQKINFLSSRVGKNKEVKDIIKNLINEFISKLDQNYFLKLKEKYVYIDSYKWPDDFNDLIYEVGEYLLTKVNKPISGKTIISAVSNVYKKGYGYTEEECQTKMEEIIEKNKKVQSISFPTRYKINPDGTREIIMNETNKFDIKLESNTK